MRGAHAIVCTYRRSGATSTDRVIHNVDMTWIASQMSSRWTGRLTDTRYAQRQWLAILGQRNVHYKLRHWLEMSPCSSVHFSTRVHGFWQAEQVVFPSRAAANCVDEVISGSLLEMRNLMMKLPPTPDSLPRKLPCNPHFVMGHKRPFMLICPKFLCYAGLHNDR